MVPVAARCRMSSGHVATLANAPGASTLVPWMIWASAAWAVGLSRVWAPSAMAWWPGLDQVQAVAGRSRRATTTAAKRVIGGLLAGFPRFALRRPRYADMVSPAPRDC